jgi:hypothetical protein
MPATVPCDITKGLVVASRRISLGPNSIFRFAGAGHDVKRGRGHAITPAGHAVRMVAFGDTPDSEQRDSWTTVQMSHIVSFLQTYLSDHRDALRHAQIKDQALAVLALIQKWNTDVLAKETR